MADSPLLLKSKAFALEAIRVITGAKRPTLSDWSFLLQHGPISRVLS